MFRLAIFLVSAVGAIAALSVPTAPRLSHVGTLRRVSGTTTTLVQRGSKPAMFAPTALLPAGLFPMAGLLPEAAVLNTVLFSAFAATGQTVLTTAGLLHSWALAMILWSTLGWQGFLMGAFYLFCGSAVTKVGKAKKEKLGIAEGRGGRRGPENVWGSAATAAICALGRDQTKD